MQHWLVKSEPGEWSWEEHLEAGTTKWDGVRNAQAQNNMKAMKKGDRAFFYHSGKPKTIVGLLEVTRKAYADPDDESGKYILVDFKAVKSVPHPVTLKQIKEEPALAELALVKQPRLSVMPVSKAAWDKLSKMTGLK